MGGCGRIFRDRWTGALVLVASIGSRVGGGRGRGSGKGKSVSRKEKLEVQVWEFKNVVT